MNKWLLGVLLFLCVVTLTTYGVVWGGPYMQARRDKATREALTKVGAKKHHDLARAFQERLHKKIEAIDKAGYKGEERKRRIMAEGAAAKAEVERVRDSHFTSPYRME